MGHHMDVVSSLKPGKNGTQRHVGELIAERKNTLAKSNTRPLAQQTASAVLHIRLHDKHLQLTAKQADGKWHPEKIWWLTYESVVRLGLQEQVANSG